MILLNKQTGLKRLSLALALLAVGPSIASQAQSKATQTGNAVSAIKESDIKRDLFALAGDHFRGREAGSLDELKASVWIADQLRAMGLQPAGDDGTFFQFFHIQRTRITETSRLNIGNHTLTHGQDAFILAPAIASVDAPLVFVGKGTPQELANVDIKGKAVALEFSGTPPAELSYRRFLTGTMNRRAAELVKAGALAVVWISNADAQFYFDRWTTGLERGRYDLPGGANTRVFSQAPTVWLPSSALSWIKQPGQQFTNVVNVESFSYPSVNIVAKVPGTDPTLKNEYVLFSTHQDHDGVRRAVAGDSIWNGADDNASGCVATMAIGRAFAQKPGKRSALFVFHGAEERGLLGSRYYVDKPTVPKESIVAVLNAEMIGRNAPDSACILGQQPPHRNSTDLVNAALAVNQSEAHFKLDTLWDKPDHPEGWYFRSDHLPYARANVPAIAFTTLLHTDYHTPKDEPDRINTAKVTRIARWIYLTGWDVANRPQRVRVDKGFKLER
ncbi:MULTISPECIES: M28 family peptidase [unclassified Spirosoma]|uniref:M28 family peptidase n=1 Tax=unclassified Spirosoma TaxID=2621999 RepID=UPI0009676F8F|nr:MULTISPECIES: M28 family peptidase [unclassified Spirosoma]MBN8821508.1 M28 family peptidase [Spirosoma sp.]OJW78287.1 MAG: peptidase M28 [Spirosoma sp. 48-14]